MERDVAEKTVAGLKRAGIDFLTYLPETRLSPILPVLEADPSFKLVATASEAEAVTIDSGAALVGRQPAVYMIVAKVEESLEHRRVERSDMDLTENKYRFVRYVERTEGKPVFLGRG